MNLELAGKIALVTGGSRGIGRATALGLAAEGARIAIAARESDALGDAAHTSFRLLEKILRAIGIQTTQRLLGRGIARLLPLIGALGVAGYAYYDTDRVGNTAIEFFSSQIDPADEGEGTGA